MIKVTRQDKNAENVKVDKT